MLELDRVNLNELCEALDDSSPEHEWWLDPTTARLELWSDFGDDFDDDAGHPYDRGWVLVDPIGSREAYTDLEEFAYRVKDLRARDLLLRAIAGRGAFRRFKDTLLEFPDLRQAWFHFHDARMRQRAIAWLRDQELISDADADRALAELPEPEPAELDGPLDAYGVARAVAADLRGLYGSRLKDVLLFGSWARGDAHQESDIDLLVILDEVPSRRHELEKMDGVLWRHSMDNDTVVTEIPVSELEYRESNEPLLARIRAEGVSVT